MNIVIVSARTFPIIKAGIAVCELIGTFDVINDVIHTRTTKREVAGTDMFIHEAAKFMGFQTRRWPAEGGASNFIRDVEMVEAADVVYALFEADHVGEGGTQHVVDKSLDQGKRTLCYTWSDAELVLIGSADAGEGLSGEHGEEPEGVPQVAGKEASERTSDSGAVPESWRRTGDPVRGVRERDTGPHP